MVFLILKLISLLPYTLKIDREVAIVKRKAAERSKSYQTLFAFLLLFIIKQVADC